VKIHFPVIIGLQLRCVTLPHRAYLQPLPLYFLSYFSPFWDSSVHIATGYALDGRGKWFLTYWRPLDRFWGPLSLHPSGVPWAVSPGVKQPGHETDHSPPARAEVNSGEVITSLPHTPSWRIALLIKHKDTFTITLPHMQLKVLSTNTACIIS
jgi:hypothetical protein